MNKKNVQYNIANIFVLLMTALMFILRYNDARELFAGYKLRTVVILIITVSLVHIIKAIRLFFALYGTEIKTIEFIKTYCKVTPVSVVFPAKIGELFRMYCYGKLIGSIFKGSVIILFDRFMDTVALVTVILGGWLLNGEKPNTLVYLLLLFIILVISTYIMFPGIYKFWTKYLLKAKASEYKLTTLKYLQRANTIYCEIETVAKGKGSILYIISLFAWSIEIGSLYILGKNKEMLEYLNSAINGNQTPELKKFVVISVVLLVTTYAITKACELFLKKVDR